MYMIDVNIFFNSFFNFLDITIGNSYVFLVIQFISFCLKSYLVYRLFINGLKVKSAKGPWIALHVILIGSALSDFAWLIQQMRREFFTELFPLSFVLFLIRIAWAASAFEFLALALFLDNLSERKSKLRTPYIIFIPVGFLLSLYLLYVAIFDYNLFTQIDRPHGERIAFKAISIYKFLVLGFSICLTISKILNRPIPKILRKQLWLFIIYLLIPYTILNIINAIYLFISPIQLNSIISITTALFTYAIYYSAKTITGLRFLNIKNHVQTHDNFSFINDFKEVLERLGHVTNLNEIVHVAHAFFKDAFEVPASKVFFMVRQSNETLPRLPETETLMARVENFITYHEGNSSLSHFLRTTKILIHDEIEFTHFNQEQHTTQTALEFLDAINADIFLPIYDKDSIIGYLIVERNCRPAKFFNTVERDEMVVFASYLSNIINLLHNRNLHTLLQHEKELKDELFNKHQELNRYKESMRSFLRTTKERKIGILFYKSKKFTFGNQAAQDLLPVNINAEEGHPLSKVLQSVANYIQEYKAPQMTTALDTNGNKLIINGIPNLDGNNVIIMLYYPEIADVVKKYIDALKDPSKWDYLLYLETTEAGKLINQLIPGSGETLLNFKIDLLKIALSIKPLLLEMPENDLEATVDIIHHISLRSLLQRINLDKAEKGSKIGLQLFGMNPLYGVAHEPPLLETLNGTGTLFINNIHYLAIETQEHLAEFVRYGFYHPLKSDTLMVANVRIICATDQNLETLVQNGTFSERLFNELKKTSLSMPSLSTLPEHEVAALLEGYTQQAIKDHTLHILLTLNPTEKNKLMYQRPVSLQELKAKVHQILANKSQKYQIADKKIMADTVYSHDDPELIHAAHLGKRALKDQAVMKLLWQKFKNQNKIAAFLGVNRSSVSRRLKDFDGVLT